MDSSLIFYFFILLLFLKSVNIDYRLIIFIVLVGLYYNYKQSNEINIETKLEDSLERTKVYTYGNKINRFDDLDEKNIREIKDIKQKIYSMNIHKNDKIEIYSAIKKYFHIYNNLDKYDYNHNWINDLKYLETMIYNKIVSLNISYENSKEDIDELFEEAQNILGVLKGKFSNNHVYNFIEHPIGYEKNKIKSYLF